MEVKNEDRMTNSIGQLVLKIIIGSLEQSIFFLVQST